VGTANFLLGMKQLSVKREEMTVEVAFKAPTEVDTHPLVLHFMCDSYVMCDSGCNQVNPPPLLSPLHPLA